MYLQGLDGLGLGRGLGSRSLRRRSLGLGGRGDYHRLDQGPQRLNRRLDLLDREHLLDGLNLLHGGRLLPGLLGLLRLLLLGIPGLGSRLDGLLEVLGYLLLGRRLDAFPGRGLNLNYHRVLGDLVRRIGGGGNLGIGAGKAPLRPGVGIGFRPVAVIGGLGGAVQGLHQDRGRTLPYHVQHLGRRLGKIDDPGRNKGAPVIYPDVDLSAVVQVCHRQQGSKGQRGVGGGIQGGVENFTGSRGASVEFRPVPGGDSLLPEI
jgi:hypothetical protein